MLIAIDFDGTIVEHRYPEIGKERAFAFETMKKLMEEGHRLVLWTVRRGERLQEAVDYCRKHGVTFFAVNENYPGERQEHPEASPKLNADLFIDNNNLGGLPDWGTIYRMIHYNLSYEELSSFQPEYEAPARPSNFFRRFFGKL